MHKLLDPGPAVLAEAADIFQYPDGKPLTDENIAAAAEGCVGIVSMLMDPITEKVLSVPGLKCVSNVAVGYDNIDVAAATKHGVFVTNTPGILDETTADFAFALLMAAARRVVQGDNFVRGTHFKGWAIDMLLGVDVNHATLGLVGIGRIGRAVAKRARGFNMRVIYSDVNPLPAEMEREMGVTRVDLPRLLRESDFVSVHVPLTDKTHHLIGAEQLAIMKPTAVLVNTSRGPVIDEGALVEALKNHRLFAAGLDVYEKEPQVHPALVGLHNVVLAPHIASASTRTRSERCAGWTVPCCSTTGCRTRSPSRWCAGAGSAAYTCRPTATTSSWSSTTRRSAAPTRRTPACPCMWCRTWMQRWGRRLPRWLSSPSRPMSSGCCPRSGSGGPAGCTLRPRCRPTSSSRTSTPTSGARC